MAVQGMYRDASQGTNAAPVQYSRAGYEASFGRYPIEDSALSEKDAIMSQSKAAENLIASLAPKLVELTDRVLFEDVWERKESPRRDRSPGHRGRVDCLKSADQWRFHLNCAIENGVKKEELLEVITHLAFYAGWPNAMSAIMMAKELCSQA